MDLPKKYVGNDTVAVYLAPYGTNTPSAHYFKNQTKDELFTWEAILSERHGTLLNTFEGVNQKFYVRAQEFMNAQTKDLKKVELSDIL